MNKNTFIAIVVVLIIALVAIGAYMIFSKPEEVKSMNIETAGQTLANSASFNQLMAKDITMEDLQNIYGINTDNVESVVGKMPLMNVKASMYLLINAKEGAVDTVKAEVEKYAEKYEEQWSQYLPDQHELVKNRKIGVVGNTVYMIIGENAETLEQEITK